jgi:hypothetical protein
VGEVGQPALAQLRVVWVIPHRLLRLKEITVALALRGDFLGLEEEVGPEQRVLMDPPVLVEMVEMVLRLL